MCSIKGDDTTKHQENGCKNLKQLIVGARYIRDHEIKYIDEIFQVGLSWHHLAEPGTAEMLPSSPISWKCLEALKPCSNSCVMVPYRSVPLCLAERQHLQSVGVRYARSKALGTMALHRVQRLT